MNSQSGNRSDLSMNMPGGINERTSSAPASLLAAKVADEVEVDVSTRAWKVSYADAIGTSLKATIEGVEVPYVDLQTLIKSKSTEREQDKVDVQRLRSLS